MLAANVIPGPQSPLRTNKQLKSHHVYTVDGHRVGVIGIDIKGKTELSSSPSPGTYLLDEVTTAQKYINELRGMGVNKIVLLSHVGLERDRAFARQLRGVDVIVGGDSHSLMGDAQVCKVSKDT